MVVEFGHFALVLATVVALFQMLIPFWGAQIHEQRMMATAKPAAIFQFLLLMVAFLALTYAYVVSDFSVANVAANSHSTKPLIYRISGVWGNHEGSMLLWVLILTLFGMLVALFGGNLPATLRANVIAVQGWVGTAFLLFILTTSNPFTRLDPAPIEGQDLNPILQDIGLAVHPPLLYLGYVGFSICFAFAVAALIEGRIDAAWARWVRPWTLAAWLFLTGGITMGSYWAYYELGWGGFWFWDPVENASFMPWLFATALLHSAIVVEKRETLKAWTILLSILGFGFSLMGTFIVRSGVITSVHAFASDPERGVFILMIFAVFVGGALTLFAFRSAALEAKGVFALVSRESALVLNNVLLAVASLVVFTGTMWPLVSELAFGRVLSVGAPFFDAAFTPFMVALAVVLPVGAVIPWKRGNLGRAVRSMWGVAVLAIALGALAFTLQTGRSALAPVGVALGTWLVLGALADLWQRSGRQGFGARLARMTRLPRADWGKALSHAGLGITIFAVSAVLGWSTEDIRVAQIGESFVHDGYTVTLTGVERVQGPNYISSMGHVTVERDGQLVAELAPEKRVYPAAGMPTTEAAIDYALIRDIYVALGDPQDGGGWALRTYVKPFASCLWLGVLIMALGGVASLSDRRYRMAAGARRAAAPQATPAE